MPGVVLVELDGPASQRRTSEVPLSRDSQYLQFRKKPRLNLGL
jgi:hypothetical protein